MRFGIGYSSFIPHSHFLIRHFFNGVISGSHVVSSPIRIACGSDLIVVITNVTESARASDPCVLATVTLRVTSLVMPRARVVRLRVAHGRLLDIPERRRAHRPHLGTGVHAPSRCRPGRPAAC